MRKKILLLLVSGFLMANFAQPVLAQQAPFTPVYPSGPSYIDWRLTLPGLGHLADSVDIPGYTEFGGSLNNERCSANNESGLAVAASALDVSFAVAETACKGAAGVPFVENGLCAAAGALLIGLNASKIPIAQCASHDAYVDSAEIEAAFENSVNTVKQVNANGLVALDNQSNLVTITDVVNTINSTVNTTNSTVNTTNSTVNTINSTANAINSTANAINSTVGAINTTVVNTNAGLGTHDVEIKALLATLQASANANAAKLDILLANQLESIRLLHTPEGRRATAVLACNGAPCNFPESP